ncbi:hypothetical protein KCU62_g9138, partial [Aureobasidium sp. EXF-3399]
METNFFGTGVESLTLTLCGTSGAETVALHPEIFTVIGALPRVKHLDLRFGGAVTIPYCALATLLAGHHINYLTISCIKRGRHRGEAHVHTTAHDLLQSPKSLKLFETLKSFNVSSSIEATWEEAVAITQMIMSISPGHVHQFDFSVDEPESFGWPKAEDYAIHQTQDIWKASLLSFAPDPAPWNQRDLNHFINQHGDQISLDEVASNGSFNHLINN